MVDMFKIYKSTNSGLEAAKKDGGIDIDFTPGNIRERRGELTLGGYFGYYIKLPKLAECIDDVLDRYARRFGILCGDRCETLQLRLAVRFGSGNTRSTVRSCWGNKITPKSVDGRWYPIAECEKEIERLEEEKRFNNILKEIEKAYFYPEGDFSDVSPENCCICGGFYWCRHYLVRVKGELSYSFVKRKKFSYVRFDQVIEKRYRSSPFTCNNLLCKCLGSPYGVKTYNVNNFKSSEHNLISILRSVAYDKSGEKKQRLKRYFV